LQIKTKIVSYRTADSKPVKQEVNSTVTPPPLVFPVLTFRKCQRVVPLVELSNGVESAVARLQEIGGAALHDDADVRRFGVAQFFDGFHLEPDVINFL